MLMLVGLGAELSILRLKLPLVGPKLVRINPEPAVLQFPTVAMQATCRLLHDLFPAHALSQAHGFNTVTGNRLFQVLGIFSRIKLSKPGVEHKRLPTYILSLQILVHTEGCLLSLSQCPDGHAGRFQCTPHYKYAGLSNPVSVSVCLNTLCMHGKPPCFNSALTLPACYHHSITFRKDFVKSLRINLSATLKFHTGLFNQGKLLL